MTGRGASMSSRDSSFPGEPRARLGASDRCDFRTRGGPVRRGRERRDGHGEESGDRSDARRNHGHGGQLQSPFAGLGLHEVKVEKTGFKAAVRTGINLEVGQDAVVSLRLEVGEIAQAVTVSGDAPLVNTTTSSVSGMVGEESVKELPLNGRSFDNLITLNPSAINYTAMKSANTTTSDGNSFSVAGRRPGDNLFLWNGIEYTGASQLADTPGGVSGDLLGIDAIREFNVLTDTYGAEYGKRAGGQVVVVTQSGHQCPAWIRFRVSPQQRSG